MSAACTCSVPFENTPVFAKSPKTKAKIKPIEEEKLKGLPKLPTSIDGTLCVCPTEEYEGFFVAKII